METNDSQENLKAAQLTEEENLEQEINNLEQARESQILEIVNSLLLETELFPDTFIDLIFNNFFEKAITNEIREKENTALIKIKFQYLKISIEKNISLSESQRELALNKLRYDFFGELVDERNRAIEDTALYADFLIKIYLNPLETLEIIRDNQNENYRSKMDYINARRNKTIDFIMHEIEIIASAQMPQILELLEVIRNIKIIEEKQSQNLNKKSIELQQQLNEEYERDLDAFEVFQYLIKFEKLLSQFFNDLENIHNQTHFSRLTALENILLGIELTSEYSINYNTELLNSSSAAIDRSDPESLRLNGFVQENNLNTTTNFVTAAINNEADDLLVGIAHLSK